MKTRKKIVCLTPMSPEDQALVEALVDGELGETDRRDLLVRLDRIDGGWKFCAISFLEAQCLRESFAAFTGDWAPFFADSPENWRSDAAPLSPLRADGAGPDVEVSDVAQVGDASGETTALGVSKPPLFSGNAALRPGTFAEYSEFNDETFSAAPVAGRRDLPEPRIIPLKQGGYRNGYRNSSRDGSDGGGPTWRSSLASMAGGFLLAVALVGVLYSQLAPSPERVSNGGDSTTLATAETTTAPSTELKNGFRNNDSPTEIAGAETSPSAPKPEPLDVDGAVRVVTFKSPGRQLDGVSVPCFAADRFDAEAFRAATNDVPPQIAEQLRRSGGRVATTRDEYRFPLEDGRVLIIPVDAYNVRYENANNVQ